MLEQSPEVEWLKIAKQYNGMKEIKGSKHNPLIIDMLKYLGAFYSDDETAWCGTFVAYCLKKAGKEIPEHWYRALSYLELGVKLKYPAYGCIGVKKRKGGGHVTFIIGRNTKNNKLYGFGGNQNDQVCVAEFNESDFEAFVWPSVAPLAIRYNLPTDHTTTINNAKES